MLRRNPNIFSAELDGQICLFNSESTEYLNLNSTGSKIWEILENPSEITIILNTLEQLYDVNQVTCRKEVESFIYKALKHKIILAE